MSAGSAHVRIVVAAPEESTRAATLDALARLGSEARIEVAHSDAEALRLARDEPADLVIRVADSRAVPRSLLAALCSSGPPVVVVAPEGQEQWALEAFRRGAADCVALGPEYAEVLPVVVLEQIRRWRAAEEQRRAERRLRGLEELNEAIVRQIPAGLAVLDSSLRLLRVNPAFANAFGVAAEEAVGRELGSVLPPDLVESGGVREMLERAARGAGPPARIARAAGGGPGARAFDVRAQRLDGSGRLLLVLADVTERDALSRRIADLTRYNEHIIDNMNSALLVVDTEGRIAFCNPTAETILGVARGGLIGRFAAELFPGTPPDRVLFSRTLENGERFKGEETVVTRPDGRLVPIGVSSAPLLGGGERRLGAVAIFQDLSEMKQLQQQLLQSEKMASIGQLAAGVAHEINNPMGFIHANLFQMAEYVGDLRRLWERVEALQDAIARGKSEEIHGASEDLEQLTQEVDASFLIADLEKATRESQEGSERIRHIVKDLREFSHHGGDDPALADLNQCLDSTANIVWSMMKHAAVLERDYGTLPPVSCYPMQLKQVFMNLLVNAYQAIQARGCEEPGRICLRTRVAGRTVVVTVQDNGVGIAAEHRERVFDPFFTTKEVGVGTGLGLATSFEIARRHGGTIRFESQPGEGATFELVLPLSAQGADG